LRVSIQASTLLVPNVFRRCPDWIRALRLIAVRESGAGGYEGVAAGSALGMGVCVEMLAGVHVWPPSAVTNRPDGAGVSPRGSNAAPWRGSLKPSQAMGAFGRPLAVISLQLARRSLSATARQVAGSA
jgi:hypothetical protein